jgi:histidinol-phosphate phosphatase family protein
MGLTLKPAVFLDRDGTIIEDRGHLGHPSEVVFYPDTVRALQKLQEHFLLFIVTNQSGVSRGVVTADEVSRVNDHVVDELRRHGVVISALYCCPHQRADQCACIKPRPYFLEKAAGEYGVNLQRSFIVGDHPHDAVLGAEAGVTGIFLLTGHGSHHRQEIPAHITVLPVIREAAEWILAYHEMRR